MKQPISDLEREALELQSLFGTEDLEGFQTDSIYNYKTWLKVREKFDDKNAIVLIKNSKGVYDTYQENATLISKFFPVNFPKIGTFNNWAVYGITVLETDIKKWEKEIASRGYQGHGRCLKIGLPFL